MKFWVVIIGGILLIGFMMVNGVLMAWSPKRATEFLNWWAKSDLLPNGLGREWEVRLVGLVTTTISAVLLTILLKAAIGKLLQT